MLFYLILLFETVNMVEAFFTSSVCYNRKIERRPSCLHNWIQKSVYSFMDSVVDLNSYVARAKELGYQALGLMDRDNLYAAYHFAQLAK